jgi:hypothetical protein
MAAHATANAESPALLGGVQVLVDGGKLVFERPEPDHGLISGLWTLLPTTTRTGLWPATYAFGNALQFDAVVVPRAERERFTGYTTEEQAADYPQGRYELQLQTAAEANDQPELDALFARRSWNDTWKLAVQLLVVIVVLAIAMNLIFTPTPPPEPQELTPKQRADRASTAAAVVGVRDPFTAYAIKLGGDHYYKKDKKDAK